MNKRKVLIYYVIAIIFICFGFIVGTGTKEYKEGYRIYDYSRKEKYPYGGGEHYAYTELGDKHVQKKFGWFSNDMITNDYYYQGNIKIPTKTLKKSIPITNLARRDYDTDFHNVSTTGIIATIIMISLILIVPFFVAIIIKVFKKTNDNQKLKEIKRLKDKLDLDIISEEEYLREKEKIISKK